MKYKLPILAFTGLLLGLLAASWLPLAGQPAQAVAEATPSHRQIAPAAAPPNVPPDELVRSAAATLRQHRSVVAKLRHRLDIYDRQLVGAGTYLQGVGDAKSSVQSRLEVKTQWEDRLATLQQISDGRWMWIRRHLKSEPDLQRVDLRRLSQAMPHEIDGAEALAAMQHINGLPGLLDGLLRGLHFDNVRAASLAGVPMYVVTGHWRGEMLVSLLPEYEQQLKAGEALPAEVFPPHLPTEVVIWLGQDDLFPYRFEFLRTEPRAWWSLQPPVVKQLLVLELFEVQYDVALERSLFRYEPGTATYTDVTERVLQGLVPKS